jgi:hypothetical protein
MAITQGKMPFVFGMVVLASLLITAPAAHAACRSPKNICKHLDDCLQRASDPNNKDTDGIRAGVKARNGQIVSAGAEACERDLGRKQQWDKWARGCSELTMCFARSCAILSDSSATQGLKDSSRLGLLPMAARYSLAQWAHLRWTRMLLGRGVGNPLLRGSRGFRPIRGCGNHMNDLVAAAF